MDTQESLLFPMGLFSPFPQPSSDKRHSGATEPIASPLPEGEIEQFFTYAGNPLAIIRFDGSLQQINPAFRNLFKNFQLEITSSWFDLIHPSDRATVLEQWQALIQSGGAGQIESRLGNQGSLNHSVGETVSDRWFAWQMTPMVEQQLVYIVGQDISQYQRAETELRQREERWVLALDERKALEAALQQANQELERRVAERTDQLQQANAALTEREALYRTLAQHIPNGAVLLFDRDLRYLLVEGDGLKQVNLDRSNLVGKTLSAAFPPDVCAAIEPYYRATLAGQSMAYEMPFQDQIYEVHTVPIHNEQGEIFAGMVLTQNITDRSRSEVLLATQNYILELITAGACLSEVLETLAQLIETQSNEAICSILLLDDTTNKLYMAASPSLPQSLCYDLADGVLGNSIDTICGTVAHTHQAVIVSDIDAEDRWAASRMLLQQYNLKACWSTPILDSQGRVLGTFALYYRTPRQPDATEQRLITIASHLAGVAIERQRSGAALKQREDQLRLITETIPQQVWTATPDGHIDYYNQRWCEFTGKAVEQLQNDGWTEIVHPDDLAQITQTWAASVKMGTEYQAEARLRAANGEYCWILGQARPLRNQQGQIVKWYGTNTDITDRKQAEASLQESEQRLQAILNQSEAVIYLKDTEGRYLLVNRQYEMLCQQTQAQQGQTNDAGRESEATDLFWSHDRDVLEAGTPLKFEERLYLPDGVHTYLSVKFPLVNVDGIPYAVCSIATDITDRKQIDLERERFAEQSYGLLQQEQTARAQAEQANRIKDEFLAVLSHELRTPLNPILGWSKLLQNRQLSPDKVQQGLEAIERNVKLQAQLIDDLLDISRILRGKLVLEMTPVDLADPIAAALETVRLAAEAKAIQLTTQFDAPIQRVFGDTGRLQQVMWNLLSNAIKFTPQGGKVTVRLSVPSELAASEPHALLAPSSPSSPDSLPSPLESLEQKPPTCQIPFVRIQVADTGKGISPKFLPHVFEHFRQQDSSTTRQFGGLGLGLAIVRQLVEAHGGTISVESAGEGQGTTFSIYLPLMLMAERANDRQPSGQTAPNLQGVRVLLVDDDVDTQALIAYLLEQQQLCVTPVSSALEALAALERLSFDVLISDIGMPGMDGYTLMRRLRTLPDRQSSNLPGIALSAYASDTDQQQALAAGFQQHLAKPLALETLTQAIAALVKPSGTLASPIPQNCI
ncbi:PAS domain-containing protein [Leptolyngbya sp. ST-U4]|uniref:PAS domain-containing protein n=1 Tax=Leptolyngbya sp. ST-U4 TaxID=2933912 RepID=UPI003298E05E